MCLHSMVFHQVKQTFNLSIEDQLVVEPIFVEIVDWLNKKRNRDEFIILYLDLSSNLGRWNQEKLLTGLLKSHFGNLLLFSNDTKSIHDNILDNHRVMIVTRRPLTVSDNIYFTVQKEQTCWWKEQDIKSFCYRNGEVREDSEELAGKTDYENLFYSRVVTNQLRYGPLNKDFIPFPSPVNFYSSNVLPLYEMGINSLATDYISNDQIEEHLWIWDSSIHIEEIAENYSQFCILLKPGADHWSLTSCKETHPILCSSVGNKEDFWVGGRLSNPQLYIPYLHSRKQIEETTVCPPGFEFKPPVYMYVLFSGMIM